MIRPCLLALVLALPTGVLSAQAMSWQPALKSYPTSFESHNVAAYDNARDEMVFVVKSGGTKVTTWRRQGDVWNWLSSNLTAPSNRHGHRVVYDKARREVLLFGGYDRTTFSDTWVWDGVSWSKKTPLAKPAGVTGHAMAYDDKRQRTVHFGGRSAGTSGSTRSATWEWDGKVWLQRKLSLSPSARVSHAMAYDSTRNQVVLFGGLDAKGVLLSDTWTWDGKVWKKHNAVVSPPARLYHSMTFDTHQKVVVLFGGVSGPNLVKDLSDTWTWNGQSWKQEKPNVSPTTRFKHSVVYDPVRQETLLIGGTSFSTLWAGPWYWRTTHAATTSVFGTGCGTYPGVQLTTAKGSLPALGENFSVEVRALPTSTLAGIMSLGFSRTAIGSTKLPFDLSSLGMKGCHLYHSVDIHFLFSMNKGIGSFQLQIPRSGSIKGAKAYLQAFGPDPLATKLGLVSSNGLEIHLGYR